MNTSGSLLVLQTRSLSQRILEPLLLLTIDVVALIGNSLIFRAVYRSSRLRAITSIYLLALSLIDIVASTVCMPLQAGVLIMGDWVYGVQACEMYGVFLHLLVYLYLPTMSLVALNRFLRTTKPNLFRRLSITRHSIAVLASLWLTIASYVAFLLLSGWTTIDFDSNQAACLVTQYSSETFKLFHYSFITIIFAIVPLALITVSYIKVFRIVRLHAAKVTPLPQSFCSARISSEEVRLTKGLIKLLFLYLICWIPTYATFLVLRFTPSSLPRGLYLLTMYLSNVSSAINPIILVTVSGSFRREVKRFFPCGKESTSQILHR